MSTVIIIGGGIAGAATAAAMQRAGYDATVLTAGMIGDGASGNPLAALYPLFTAKPSPMGDVYLAAYQQALTALQDCPAFSQTGVTNYPKKPEDINKWRQIADQPALQPYVKLQEGAGKEPMLLFPQAGVVTPNTLLPWLLEGITVRESTVVNAISYQDDAWHVHTDTQQYVADKLVLACSTAVQQFIPWLSLEPVRGQLTYLAPTAETINKTIPTCRDGYVLPTVISEELGHNVAYHVLGSSYRRQQTNTDITTLEHVENLNRLATLWPEAYASLAGGVIGGRASIRARSTDTLPYAGPMPDIEAAKAHYTKHGWQEPLPEVAMIPNLYTVCGLGSRGFTTAWLAAEVISNPQQVDDAVRDTIAPARLLQRLARRGKL